jgi:hypothetical protein
MPRQALSLVVPDAAAFARALGTALKHRHATRPEPPGHVELLNLIARALGHRNLQALKAAPATTAQDVQPLPVARTRPSPEIPPLSDNALKALGQFDAEGRLVRWPAKYSVQRLAMWALWTRFEAKRPYSEKEVNAILKEAHTFGDHVTLRRELINHQLLTRKSDCSEYRKLPARPDEETRALLKAWRARSR